MGVAWLLELPADAHAGLAADEREGDQG